MTDAAPGAPGLLLDTDHLDFLTSGEGVERDRLLARLATAAPVAWAASTVSFEEQVRGALGLLKGRKPNANLMRGYELLETYRRFYGSIPVLPFDAAAAAEFDRLDADAGSRRVGTNDLRIAAVALAHDLTLLTRNAKDFARVPGLRFEDWTA